MKDDKLKGQSQKAQTEQKSSASKKPSIQKADEDLDFEILDALEQIEQGGKAEEEVPEDESALDLTFDEGDLTFEEEAEPAGEFQFDESVVTGLEEEMPEPSEEFGLEGTIGDEIGVDIQDEGEFDLSLESGVDFGSEEPGTQTETGEMSFDLEEEAGEVDFGSLDTQTASEEETSPGFGIEREDADFTLEDAEFSLDMESIEGEEEISSEMDLGELNLQESSEIGLEETEEEFEAMEEAPDFGTGISDETLIGEDEELPTTDLEEEFEEFPGKAVISVEGEEVIDLGDETEFEQGEQSGELEESWDIEEHEDQEREESIEISDEESEIAVAGLTSEQEQEEEFMASLEDIDIDLGAEETAGELEMPGSEPPPPEEGEEEYEAEAAGPEEGETPAPEIETTAEISEPEQNEREELGLTLRLGDVEVDQFETLVNRAKTLQSYVEELEKHQGEIKETIYQKLLQEYTSRKTDIFKKSEFVSMEGDIEQDLREMLARREEFAAKVDRLNEELEEVKVRHLVGEYSDADLSTREEARKTEIVEWQDKAEKIGKFIARYQELLDTEQALNPLGPEETPEEWETPEPEIETPSAEGLTEEEISEESGFGAEEVSFGELAEPPENEIEEEETAEEMISCKKCGKPTPAAEKFCVNCGAKAR